MQGVFRRVSKGIRGYSGCILCQKRLRLSVKVDECKPLAVGTYREHRESFRGIQARGMAQDLSWDVAADRYEQKLIEAKYSW